jgi:hypothetical protein
VTAPMFSRVGDLRPSQLLWSFGVGAVVDLPNFSVIVLGLDDWEESRSQQIAEERLLAAIVRNLGPQLARLLSPPRPPQSSSPYDPLGPDARIGVPVATFPEWFRCPICQLLAPIERRLFEFKPNPYRPDQSRYVHAQCPRGFSKPPTVVPARFLVACERGHLDDFPWEYFVHRGQKACSGTLKFYEVGASLETANLWVECNDCGQKRSMVDAFGQHDRPSLPACRGRHPHLRAASGSCPEPLKAMLLGASNSWFPETRSVLSVPTRAGRLAQLVEEKWLSLRNASTPEVLKAFMASPGFGELAEFSETEVWQELEARHAEANGTSAPTGASDLKRPEWEILSRPDAALNGKDFWLSEVAAPVGYSDLVQSVVLVERLREVNGLVGFTRLRSTGESNPGEARARRAPLSTSPPKWVPATEVRGEGIFLSLRLDRAQAWTAGEGLRTRARILLGAHEQWRSARHLDPPDGEFPGSAYLLLHTLSHALMREFSLECGYGAASIRERIYASAAEDIDMAGILIYTSASDSEGTLGGLVSLGRPPEFGRLLRQALDRSHLCASDPLCSEHDPRKDGTVHGAACHACLFAPETSCESGNRYLDRATLVSTFRTMDAAFFPTSSP